MNTIVFITAIMNLLKIILTVLNHFGLLQNGVWQKA